MSDESVLYLRFEEPQMFIGGFRWIIFEIEEDQEGEVRGKCIHINEHTTRNESQKAFLRLTADRMMRFGPDHTQMPIQAWNEAYSIFEKEQDIKYGTRTKRIL